MPEVDIPVKEIFDPAQIHPAYQPIVDLDTGEVVAVEALARWPSLSVPPDSAFDRARLLGRLEELDLLCQRAAIEGLRGSSLPEGFSVFVNVEPGSAVDVLTERTTGPKLFVEITERALLHNPADLLRSIRRMRASGCGIALDDVGAVPESLALLPFVAPDVIKLDISLIQDRPSTDQARIFTAVSAYAERTGATVLAEGIENEAHRQKARALGATLGQGWHLGRPGPIPGFGAPRRIIGLQVASTETAGTPFGLLDPRQLRIGSMSLLLSVSRHIEQQGSSLETPPIVLSAFQDASRFTPATNKRYRELAARCPLVVALGAGMLPFPAPGVRGGNIAPDDQLRGEWTVVVVGPHYSGALIAKDLGDTGPNADRRFLFSLTHDHDTVVAAARLLLGRVQSL